MEKAYGVVPREEHYNCIIHLLGCAGRLKRPKNLSTECRSSQMHTDGALSAGLAGSMVMQREAKLPLKNGSSWVDVGNKTHVFGAKDWSHPRRKEIYEKLDSLLVEIKRAGYVPCTDSVAVDMDDSEKLKVLHHHSERIAIAFALLSIPFGKPIIVKKNLRVCGLPFCNYVYF